jgi:hypothetical protein
MASLKLPIGIQSFSEIRTGGYAYVDKTPYVASLVNEGKYYFLSRPRRFGKSLFLDTLDCAFSGKKELFQDLFLNTPESGWDFSKKYPVIRISLSQRINSTVEELHEHLTRIIRREAERYSCTVVPHISPGFQLEDLIRDIYKKTGCQVVLLVDEYDKPILDNVHIQVQSVIMRDELRSFYGMIKDLDPLLKFVFLTGVSKFAKTGIFSGLNNLNDITLDARYSAICGYTHEDVMHVFSDYIHDFHIAEVREWYNGYSWTGETVYNPFDILLLFSKGVYRPYWFETGTPTFLLQLWQERPRLPAEYDGMIAGEELLGSFDPEKIRTETLLFQAGYLTIRSYVSSAEEGTWYTLGFPNREVRESFNRQILALLQDDLTEIPFPDIRKVLESGNSQELKNIFYGFLSSIPHDNYRNNLISHFEGYYASVVYAYMASLGYEIIAEDTTNKGRIDLTVKTRTYIWIFELKVMGIDRSGDMLPIDQIRQRGYAKKYTSDPRQVIEVGIIFNPETRNIERWDVEKPNQ